MDRMFTRLLNIPSHIARFFTSISRDPEDYVQECWIASWPSDSRGFRNRLRRIFGRSKDGSIRARFMTEHDEKYDAVVTGDGIDLSTGSANIFAWTDDPLYRYRDLEIDAVIRFLDPVSRYAAGLLFRKLDDTSFYDVLVSTQGMFRLDAVFNGSQRPLISWTAIPDFDPGRDFSLRIIARDTHLSLYIDDSWIGEIADETLSAGKIAFAIQHYAGNERVTARLCSLKVESRPVEVEASWYRWTSLVPADGERRALLARTFMNMEQFVAAGVQLRKIERLRPLTVDERLLLATCRLNSGHTDEALIEVDTVLAEKPDQIEAIVQKANILYLQNRLLDLKEFLDSNRGSIADLPGMQILTGNCAYGLGDWNAAVEGYTRAIGLQHDMPLFHVNLGHAEERRGNTAAAIEAYAGAARLLFREESYEELERVLAALKSLDPDHPQIPSLEGKLAFHDGNLIKAYELFRGLIESGSADSSVFFLTGIIAGSTGAPSKQRDCLIRAIEMDDDVAVYWLRYAEYLFSVREDCAEALARAIELDPEDPWALNLSGLVDLENGLPGPATMKFRRALERSDDDGEIAANLAEALYRCGKTEEAFTLLHEHSGTGACMDQLGRLYLAEERYSEAVTAFQAAVRLDEGNTYFREHLASAFIESDLVLQAEELLSSLLNTEPTAERYNLMGHVALAKGEFARAQSAYEQALTEDPGNITFACNLVELLMRISRFAEARATWNRYLDGIESDRVESGRVARLDARIRNSTHRKVECSMCGRVWWVPRDIERQPRMVFRGEPPEDSPAGKCGTCGNVYCVSCAKSNLKDGRFVCTTCDEPLKLSEDSLKYLVSRHVR